jgi:drug/metabolite transporter (DMT)-like permease
MESEVSASDWSKGISLSILASIIGGASKLAIRKSWLMEEELKRQLQDSLQGGVIYQEEEEDAIAEQDGDPLHQRQSRHSLAHHEEEQESETIDVPELDALQPKRQNSRDEDTPSLRSRRTLSRSASDLSVLDVDIDDDDDDDVDEDYSCWTGSKRKLVLARILRGSGMIGMTLLNPLACVLAMNYASPSILAPFSGLTLVWIVLLSNPVIGEQPTALQIMAACLIIFGEVIVALFGDHTNDEGVTVEDVVRISVLLWSVSWALESSLRRALAPSDSHIVSFSSSPYLLYYNTTNSTISQRDSYFRTPFLLYFAALTLWMLLMFYWMRHRSVSPTLKRFAWGVSSGSITGLQNFLKDASTLLKATRASGQGFPWYLPLFAILAVLSAFSGLLLLTACMKRYDATYSAAMFVGSFVVSASIMSMCHYSTFAHLETLWNKILYPAGLLILMGGVLMLVQEKKEPPDDNDEDDSSGTSTPEERSESESALSKTRRSEMVRTPWELQNVSDFVRRSRLMHIEYQCILSCVQ